MSRQIDLTKPLSDEDREYLISRNREYEVSLAPVAGEFQDPAVTDEDLEDLEETGNDQLEGLDDLESQDDSDGEQGDDELKDLTVPELKALLTAKGLPTSGSKQEMIDRLNG